MNSGTFLGYRDKDGNEMHCARPICDDPVCRDGCIEPVARLPIKLRECPFCGATPTIVEIEPHCHAGGIADFMPDHPGSAYIDCACGVGMIDANAEIVTQRWNARVGNETE